MLFTLLFLFFPYNSLCSFVNFVPLWLILFLLFTYNFFVPFVPFVVKSLPSESS